jgi:hypothetical protein
MKLETKEKIFFTLQKCSCVAHRENFQVREILEILKKKLRTRRKREDEELIKIQTKLSN